MPDRQGNTSTAAGQRGLWRTWPRGPPSRPVAVPERSSFRSTEARNNYHKLEARNIEAHSNSHTQGHSNYSPEARNNYHNLEARNIEARNNYHKLEVRNTEARNNFHTEAHSMRHNR